MRLEKGHFIVGQDTDALTGAFSAGLAGLVKLDKADFVGKPELVWQKERGDELSLVGLQPVDGSVLPAEASQIVEGERRIVGRVTSSRISPTLGRSICLGLLASRLAEPDTVVHVKLPDGRRIPARVMEHHAHFDPEGVRLRG
jgi:sarcosine oxidase subunit alpha